MFLGFELSFGEDRICYSYGPKPTKRLTITNSGCQEKIFSGELEKRNHSFLTKVGKKALMEFLQASQLERSLAM